MATKLVQGDKKVIVAMHGLPESFKKKALRKATREVVKRTVLPNAKARAPVAFGDLEESLGVRAVKTKRGSDVVGHTVSTREGFFKGDQFYAGFQEFGWFHWQDGSFQPGQPFLRPSLYEQPRLKISTMAHILRQELPAIVRDARNKAQGLQSLASSFDTRVAKELQ